MRRVIEILSELVPARVGLVVAAVAVTVGLWVGWALLEEGRRKQLGKLLFRNVLFYVSVVLVAGIASIVPIRSLPGPAHRSPGEPDQFVPVQPINSGTEKKRHDPEATRDAVTGEQPEEVKKPSELTTKQEPSISTTEEQGDVGSSVENLEALTHPKEPPVEPTRERWYVTQSLSRSYHGASALPGEEVRIVDDSGQRYIVSFQDGRQASVFPGSLSQRDPRIEFEMVRPRQLRGYLAAHVTTGFLTAVLSLTAPEQFWDKDLGAVAIDLERVATIETTPDAIILVTTDGTRFVSTNNAQFVFIFGKETMRLTTGRERLLRRVATSR